MSGRASAVVRDCGTGAGAADRRRILIGDTNAYSVGVLSRQFSSLECEVWGTSELDQFVEVARTIRPAVAILEPRIGRSDQESLEALMLLKEEMPAGRFTVVTDGGSIACAVYAIRCGLDGYFTKPATAHQIMMALDGPDRDDVSAFTLQEAIWHYMRSVVTEAGSIAAAARRLRLDRRSFRRMLDRYETLCKVSPTA